MMRTLFFATLALGFLLGIGHGASVPRQTVAQWVDSAPVVDGKLNDAAWRSVKEEGDFVLVTDSSKPALAPTYVKVLTDGKALYLGFRCVEPKLDRVRAVQTQRDDAVWTDDSLEVVLDPDNRKKQLYHLIINSVGVQYDAVGKITLPETSNDDAAWNGKWECACSRGKGEWYAEYRLPFEVFGISMDNGACIGINLGRGRVGARREDSSWAATRIEYVNPAYLGELYLPDQRGQVMKVALPKQRGVVRGTPNLELGFGSTFADPVRLHWNATLEGAARMAQQSGTYLVPRKGRLLTQIPVSLPDTGDCGIAVTVREADSWRTLYQGYRNFKVLPEIEVANCLYALAYQRAEAKVTVHLPPSALRGARLEAVLLRRGDPLPLAIRSQPARAGAQSVVSFSLENRSAGDYVLRAQVRLGGRILASADSLAFPFTPKPAVGFDKSGFLTVSNKPFFPVGLYTIQARDGNSHDAIMEECRQAGFNTTVFYAYTVDTITPLLDAAARHDLRAFVYPANPYRVREHAATRAELIGEIQARMRHPALLGWYLVDEPEGIGVSSVETVRDYYQLVKETDPSHPCSLVIMSPGAAANYGDSADIVWIDPYPVPYSPVTFVSECMDGAHKSVAKDKPVWAIPQAFDWSVWKTGRLDKVHRPTPAEERCMTYLALVHGAKGIIYWAHTASKYYIRDYPEHWAGLKKLAGELRDLSPVLLAADSRARAELSPRACALDMMVKQLDGRTYLFAVNREPTSTQAQITLKGARLASDVEVLFENRKLPAVGNAWTDQFAPLEVHVYRLTAK